MSNSINLMTLAAANLSKDKDQVKLEALQEQVEEAGVNAGRELFDAKKAAKAAKKRVASMHANPNYTLAQIVTAQREAELASKTLEDMSTLYEARFGASVNVSPSSAE